MHRCCRFHLLFVLLTVSASASPALESKVAGEFPLQEISAFDLGFNQISRAGAHARIDFTTRPECIRVYPAVRSEKRLCGVMRLAREARQRDSGTPYGFVIDESGGPGTGYDTLHFDANHDGDLANDAPRLRVAEPPRVTQPPYPENEWKYTVFEELELPLVTTRPAARSIRVMPRLVQFAAENYACLQLIPTTARQGDIRFGSLRAAATLVAMDDFQGRYDTRATGVFLSHSADALEGQGTDHQLLDALRPMDGKWYWFSTTPGGELLRVHRHTGKTGLLRAAAGGRKVDNVTMSGHLFTQDWRSVPVGKQTIEQYFWGVYLPEPVSEWRLPAGDYFVTSLQVTMAKLKILVQANRHVEGGLAAGQIKPPKYSIQIREDRPVTLDFSNTPEVMFVSPKPGTRLRPGDTLEVSACLIDPKLDLIIQELKEIRPNDTQTPMDDAVALSPSVVITNQHGDKVAEGVMPFG